MVRLVVFAVPTVIVGGEKLQLAPGGRPAQVSVKVLPVVAEEGYRSSRIAVESRLFRYGPVPKLLRLLIS